MVRSATPTRTIGSLFSVSPLYIVLRFQARVKHEPRGAPAGPVLVGQVAPRPGGLVRRAHPNATTLSYILSVGARGWVVRVYSARTKHSLSRQLLLVFRSMPTSSRTLTRLSVLMTSQEFRYGAFERAVLRTGRDWHTLSVVPRSLQGTDSTCSPHRQAPRRLRGTTAARACHHRIPAVWNSRTARSPRQYSQSVSIYTDRHVDDGTVF